MSDTLPEPLTDESAPDGLVCIVYTSTATVEFDELELALLLAISRRNNDAQDTTGVLLYREGRFMQALEGPRAAVEDAMGRIGADPRHTDVRVLDEEPLTARRFGSWSMGYRSPAEQAVPTWFGSPEALEARPESPAEDLLRWFRNG
jgi:hypothetical protein